MRRQIRAAHLTGFLVLALVPFASGCLSHEYRVSQNELQRLANLPPQERGQRLRAVQKIGERRSPPVPADNRLAAPPPQEMYGPGGPGDPDVGFYVGMQLGPYPGPHGHRGPAPSSMPGPGTGGGGRSVGTTPSGSSGTPVPATSSPRAGTKPAMAKSSGSGGGSGGGGGINTGNLGDDLAVVAVVLIAVAAFAALGLVATEGARYDGYLAVDPEQPLHLQKPDGQQISVSLAQLTPELAAQTSEATLADDEGWGLLTLGRAPLDRKGFTFKFELGTAQVGLERYLTSGFSSNIQLGYFPWQHVGLLGTLSLGFGSDDFDRHFFRNHAGIEAQAFLPGLSIVHLGGFANYGNNFVTADQGFLQSRPALGTGLLLEIELNTRLALMGRAGYAFTNRPLGGWDAGGMSFTAGVAIY